ncbi:MAG: DUF4258 domain-containing protein [Ignavibacteriae bacterium]|nr:DUF4258 domain-containing protein [Ignavibacteriota bacterium]
MKALQTNKKQPERKLNWNIQDPITHKKYRVEYLKTEHLEKRICQRNFNDEFIQIAVDYGKAYFKQGLIFYVLGDKNVPSYLPIQEQKRFQNIVVVVASDHSHILTVYRSKNPFKHIKKKSKRLFTEIAAQFCGNLTC